jgi:surface protein
LIMKIVRLLKYFTFLSSILLLCFSCSRRQFTHTRILIAGNMSDDTNKTLSGYSTDGDIFTLVLNSSEPTTSLEIPAGEWYFYGLHIDKNSNTKCAYTHTQIAGLSQVVEINYKLSNCNQSIFGETDYHDEENQFHKIKLFSCNEISKLEKNSSSCGEEKGGILGSFRLVANSVALSTSDTPILETGEVSFGCKNIDLEDYSATYETRLPVGSSSSLPMHFTVEFYDQENCEGTSTEHQMNYSFHGAQGENIARFWPITVEENSYSAIFFANKKYEIGAACNKHSDCDSNSCSENICIKVTGLISSNITLTNPISSPSPDKTPTFTVENLSSGHNITLYAGDDCTSLVTGSGTVPPTEESVQITLSAIAEPGEISISGLVEDEDGNKSTCINNLINYNYSTDFTSVWRTTEGDKKITIPTDDSLDYNYTINWGDGSVEEITLDTSPSHTYNVAGDYTVIISGVFPTIKFDNTGDKDKIISIPNLGDVGWTSFESAFYGCQNLGLILGGNTSNVTSMNKMFRGATLADPDTSSWNTSNVTSMNKMFKNAITANPDTSSWDTSKVTTMWGLFSGATSANPDTAEWNTSNVTIMKTVFKGATSANPDTSSWVTSNVTTMWKMFNGATSANPDTAEWNTSNVTNMNSLFTGAILANPDTSAWNTSNVTKMQYMFDGATLANPSTSTWDVGAVTDMTTIFKNSGISDTNYSNFLNMAASTCGEGSDCEGSNIDIGTAPAGYYGDQSSSRTILEARNWTIKDTGLSDDFLSVWQTSINGESITIPTVEGLTYNYTINWGDGSAVQSIDSDTSPSHTYSISGEYTITISGTFPSINFNDGGDKDKIISIPNLGDVGWTNFQMAFKGSSLGELYGGNTSGVTNMQDMFMDTQDANPDTSGWNTSNVENMMSMFANAASADPDVSGWNTTNVTQMTSLFEGAVNANPDVSQWNTSSVQEMGTMFNGATSANPDVSGWNTSNVSVMHYMFSGAGNANPDTSLWVLGSITTMEKIFNNSGISTENYTNFLIRAESTPGLNDIDIGTSPAKYYAIASSARDALIDNSRGWTIADDDISPDFVSVWQTTEIDKVITIPMVNLDSEGAAFTYDYTIDWGDGSDSTDVTSYNDVDATHTYAEAGEYTIIISASDTTAGTMETIRCFGADDKDNLLSIPNLGDMGWTSFDSAFYGCSNLVEMYGGDTSNVNSMRMMFHSATNADPDTSLWNVSSVTNMSSIFSGSAISDDNYSNFLIMAEDTSEQTDIDIGTVPAYYNSGDAATARQSLIDLDWDLTEDEGEVP